MKEGNFFTELDRCNVYKVAVARPGIDEQITPHRATPIRHRTRELIQFDLN
jgi:hypothetical protein